MDGNSRVECEVSTSKHTIKRDHRNFEHIVLKHVKKIMKNVTKNYMFDLY